MIYKAVWEDGREAMIRADNEERARQLASEFRAKDPLFDFDVSQNPTSVVHVPSKGPAETVLAGWSAWVDAA
jgi:hypothetical protein